MQRLFCVLKAVAFNRRFFNRQDFGVYHNYYRKKLITLNDCRAPDSQKLRLKGGFAYAAFTGRAGFIGLFSQ